jgi:hypothetical protein
MSERDDKLLDEIILAAVLRMYNYKKKNILFNQNVFFLFCEVSIFTVKAMFRVNLVSP